MNSLYIAREFLNLIASHPAFAILVAMLGWVVTNRQSLRAQERAFQHQITSQDRAFQRQTFHSLNIDIIASLGEYQAWLSEVFTTYANPPADITEARRQDTEVGKLMFRRSSYEWRHRLHSFEDQHRETIELVRSLAERQGRIEGRLTAYRMNLADFQARGRHNVIEYQEITLGAEGSPLVADQITVTSQFIGYLEKKALATISGKPLTWTPTTLGRSARFIVANERGNLEIRQPEQAQG